MTGDDRILPIGAFDATSAFRWDQPEGNFLRHFLEKNIAARWQHMRSTTMGASVLGAHCMWGSPRSKLSAAESLDTVSREGEVPMETLQRETALWNQGWPYNTTVVANNGNTSGIPTGCTATAMNTNYRYKGTSDLRSGHETPMSDSILAGLPVILSSSTHNVVADGYRDDISPYFHINAGWGGGSNGWYNLDQVPGTDKTVDRSYPYSSPNNYMFVDGTWSGTENGNLQNPFDTISEGYTATPTYGQLWIRSGSYGGAGNVPVTFTRAMTVHPYRGSVIIGN